MARLSEKRRQASDAEVHRGIQEFHKREIYRALVHNEVARRRAERAAIRAAEGERK